MNASIVLEVDGTLTALGVMTEVTHCRVDGAEVTPPSLTILSNGSLLTLTNLHLNADMTVVVNGCTVEEAALSTLGVRYDTAASDLPILQVLAPLLLERDRFEALLSGIARTEINNGAENYLPFDDVDC